MIHSETTTYGKRTTRILGSLQPPTILQLEAFFGHRWVRASRPRGLLISRREWIPRYENSLEPLQARNLIRAVVVNSAKVDRNLRELFDNKQSPLLRTVGYGIPTVEASWSSPSRITLFSEDVVAHRTFHVYSLTIPSEFLEASGRRSVRVSLAYNPSTRLSRRDYISTAMWLEVYRGLTSEQIFEYRSAYRGDGETPVVPRVNKLDFKPGGQTIRMSTVQTRAWESNQGTKLNYSPVANAEATLQIFVGCQLRFPSPLGEDKQAYALVVTLEHENQQIDLYQLVRNRVRPRIRV